jgi:hypothetical protein
MAKSASALVPSLKLGTVKGGWVTVTDITITYDDQPTSTNVVIDGMASSKKPLELSVDFFLYDKATDSTFLTHGAAGSWMVSATPRAVRTALSIPGKGQRPAYARLQLYESWITDLLGPK